MMHVPFLSSFDGHALEPTSPWMLDVYMSLRMGQEKDVSLKWPQKNTIMRSRSQVKDVLDISVLRLLVRLSGAPGLKCFTTTPPPTSQRVELSLSSAGSVCLDLQRVLLCSWLQSGCHSARIGESPPSKGLFSSRQ